MKKFFALVLALVMALSLTTVAWGAGVDCSAGCTSADTHVAAIGHTHYTSLEEAVADVAKYDVAGGTALGAATEIKLLKSTNAGLDIGNSSGTAAQNIILNLNGKTLTLSPAVGSTGTVTNGIRVLAYSKLEINGDGTVKCSDEVDSNGNYIKVGIANYGTLVLDDVDVLSGDYTLYTINNRGALTLDGTTYVENGQAGDKIAVTNDPYNYIYTNTDASLTIASANVSVGTVQVELYGNAQNDGDVVLNISAGHVEKIVDDGASTVDVVGNITGGSFGNDVSTYVADGYRLVNGTVASVPANTNGVVGGYEGQLTVKGAPRQAITNFTKTAAVTPDDVNEDGLYNMPGDVIGSIEYYTFNLGGGVAQNYYQVDSVNDADLIVYVGDSLVPYMYLANEPAGGFQYWYGVASFNDFGSACGQFKYVDYDATKSYYVYAGQVFVLDDDGAVNLKVGTKFVQANNITASGKWVAHTPVYAQNDKGVVTGISCAKCSDVGVIVSNFAALPTAMKAPGMNFPVPGSTSKYYYWVDTAVVTPSTDSDKVQSAETFDAGIAMYVGMSVMAAAGSAVVIGKKKD